MARFQETNTSDEHNIMGDLGSAPNPSDTGTLAEARFPKARKPYMITKQREKWTEEEHKLFLEAMQLHGRAWRRIQEHIGSKTAVQIRSHAQKFFSKVIRESSGDNGKNSGAGAEAPIQIPPPRPKRKSVHPYPCNRRSAPGLPRLEKPQLRMQSTCEQGSGSPTSVVTTSQIGSECSDSDTSTIDIEERCPTTTPSVQTAEVAVQVPPTDDHHQLAKGSSTSSEVVCDTSEAPRIKLFGQTVAVNDSHQQPNPDSRNLQSVTNMELDTSSETSPSSGTGNISSPGAPEANEWSPWMANAQQFMCYVPQGAVFFSYNGGSVSYPTSSNTKAGVSDQHKTSEAEDKLTQREASLAESNTTSTSVPEPTTQNSAVSFREPAGGDDRVSPAVGFRKFVAPSSVHQRGFMPYKRCAAESKVLQPQALSEEADGEMTRLCL